MNFQVSIEKQADGSYIAYNTNADGLALIGTGATVSQAKEDFFNSMHEVLESYEKDETIPEFLLQEPTFKFDLSSLFEYYNVLNVSAFAKYVGINNSLMHQYKKGNTYISDKQLKKIESAIHALGRDFLNLTLG